MNFDEGWHLFEPDMVIGRKSKMKGDIKFEGILRIEGHLDGNIIAPIDSRVVISPDRIKKCLHRSFSSWRLITTIWSPQC